ncbi:hypothetical protein Tco_1243218 [Tanacetum coccineum]
MIIIVNIVTFSILSTSVIVYTIASLYTGRDITFTKAIKVANISWIRLMITLYSMFLTLFAYNLLYSVVVFLWNAILREYVNMSIMLIIISIPYTYLSLYLITIWEIASVVSVLEDSCGLKAVIKASDLMNGKKKVAITTEFYDEYDDHEFDVAVEFVVETSLNCFGYLIFGLDQGIDAIDGLDGTERGYQGLCLGEMFWLLKQNDALEKKSNGYLRKGRKTKPKRQNRTRNGKAWKRQSQDKSPIVSAFADTRFRIYTQTSGAIKFWKMAALIDMGKLQLMAVKKTSFPEIESSGMNLSQKDKNKTKRTKSSTGMRRVREIKAEGVPIFYGPTRAYFDGLKLVMIGRLRLKIEERLKALDPSPLPYIKRPAHTV